MNSRRCSKTKFVIEISFFTCSIFWTECVLRRLAPLQDISRSGCTGIHCCLIKKIALSSRELLQRHAFGHLHSCYSSFKGKGFSPYINAVYSSSRRFKEQQRKKACYWSGNEGKRGHANNMQTETRQGFIQEKRIKMMLKDPDQGKTPLRLGRNFFLLF